jgi:antitoxin Phd
MTDANQNFSKVARLVDENGAAVILKNNLPRYVLIDYRELRNEEAPDGDTIMEIARKYMTKSESASEI